MKLYYSPGACSIGIHVLLQEIGKPFQTEKVDLQHGQQRSAEFTGINPPWRMSGTRAELGSHVPGVGEHTQAILKELLHMTPDELQCISSAGAFGKTKPAG